MFVSAASAIGAFGFGGNMKRIVPPVSRDLPVSAAGAAETDNGVPSGAPTKAS